MTSAWGLRIPFLLMAAATAAFLPSLLAMSVPQGDVVDTTKGLMGRLIRMPAVKAAIALNAAEYVSIGVFDAIYARYLTDLGAGTTYIGLTLAVFAMPLVILAPFGGRLADRRGAFRVCLVALAITVPAQALYGANPSIVCS